MFVQNFLCFSLCLLSFALPLGTTEKKELEKKAFLFFMLSFQVCIDIDKIPPLSLLQAEQSQISQLSLMKEMLQAPKHPCGPPRDSLHQFPVFLELESPELNTVL